MGAVALETENIGQIGDVGKQGTSEEALQNVRELF